MNAPIVVGYVPNEYGAAALAAAVSESKLRNTDLVVVNATKGDAYVDDRFATESDLVRVRDELASLGRSVDVRQSVGADVADQVLEVADEVKAALVVIGLRHRTPVGKLIMGSVAQRILMGSHCPVLAVKPAD